MRMLKATLMILIVGLVAGCGRGHGSPPPGQVKHATGYNPASGKVHVPGPGPGAKIK
jgi:hypothetical protein